MRRLLAILSVALSISAWSVLAVPTAGRAQEATTIGRTTGTIECRSYQYELADGSKRSTATMPCDRRWTEDVPTGPEWTFSQTKSFEARAGNGISYAQTIEQTVSFEQTLDSAGNLTELTLTADLLTTVSHAGNTVVELHLAIPFRTEASALRLHDSLSVTADGGGNYVSFGEVAVSLECTGMPAGAAPAENRLLERKGRDVSTRNEGDATLDVTVETGDGRCVLEVDAKVTARNSDIIKSDHLANAEAQLELTLREAPCDLGGVVRVGVQAFDAATRTMSGIPVELLDADGTSAHREVTNQAGRYCFRDVEAADFGIRASLVDAAHDPSIFRTVYAPSTDDVITEGTVKEEDFGRDDFDIDFRPTEAAPWLSDVADVHWESTRFVDWLLSSGIASPAELGSFTIETNSDKGTSYDDAGPTVRIEAGDTPFSDRDTALSECPENCEWHEIGHHLEDRLQFASSDAAACAGREVHGGWRNASSCDSLVEGFPSFLSVLASMDIDAGRGAAYATPNYSVFGSVEDNGHRPWGMWQFGDRWVGDEDQTVTELLWDLVDDTPIETDQIVVQTSSTTYRPNVSDLLHVNGPALVRLLVEARPQTVADLRTDLRDSGLVGLADTTASIDLDADGTADVSALDAVFLMHGFHPVPDLSTPHYPLGGDIGTTDRQEVDPDTGSPIASPGTALTTRNHWPAHPGSAILIQNASAEAKTFTIDLAYPATASHFEVVVGGGASRLVQLELPPYWAGWINPAEALPACGGVDQRTVGITISGGGLPALELDSCEYWHAVAQTTGDHAITFGGTPAGPVTSAGPGASPDPVGSPGTGALGGQVAIIAVALAAVTVLALILALYRRRRAPR